jgi:hypothetical protein
VLVDQEAKWMKRSNDRTATMMRLFLPQNKKLLDFAFGRSGQDELERAREKLKEARKEADDYLGGTKFNPMLFVPFGVTQDIIAKVMQKVKLPRVECVICLEKQMEFVPPDMQSMCK